MAHRHSVYILNFFLTQSLRLMGSSLKFIPNENVKPGETYIFVANHQSLYDITGLYWYLRKFHPVFVSKLSLAKGIPSVSYNLRHSGAALINRKNRRQAVSEILRMAQFVKDNKFSAVIFPEGTRRPGVLLPFKIGGIDALLKKNKGAKIVPVSIRGTGKLHPRRKYPMDSFRKIVWEIHDPISTDGVDLQSVLDQAHDVIKEALGNEISN